MNNELCKKCIDSKNVNTPVNNVCEVCKHIDTLGNGGKHRVYRGTTKTSVCCGQCNYKRKSDFSEDYYCEAARHFDLADRRIIMPYIRKNYLNRNTPKWCPFPKSI